MRSAGRRRAWRAVAWLAACLIAAGAATAAEPKFKQRKLRFTAEQQPLKEVLRGFATAQGWSISLPPGLDETISARFDLTAPALWDLLTSRHNLQWYWDGQVMHVSHAADMRTEVHPMPPETYRRFALTLDRLDIQDRRFPLRYDADAGMAIVSGPPRLVDLATAVAAGLDGESGGGAMVTRVVRLRSALAADTQFPVGGQTVRLEGVASVMRRILGSDVPAAKEAAAVPEATPRMAPLKDPVSGRPVAATPEPKRDADARYEAAAPVAVPRTRPTGQPRIEAHAGLNAVIVRDFPSRMQEHLDLIEALDRPRLLVEIEARMVEVERTDLDELGIDWQLSGGRYAASGSNGVQAPQLTLSLASAATSRLLARVRALESSGRARVVMSPRVLTLDNTEALIENTSTAYVKVAGNLEANLFAVSTGALLRILPTVTGEEGQRRVRLAVTLEDGLFADRQVENTPVVQRSRIHTHSELLDGGTLVVGGLRDELERSGRAGVPGLSRLPGIGAAFGTRGSERNTRERVYLLTPRVLQPGTAVAHAAEPAWPAEEPSPRPAPAPGRVDDSFSIEAP